MPDLDHFNEILSQFRASSVVDVLLIALLIFSTLRLLTGTRAMTQVRGAVVLIAFAVFLGRALDLTTVNYLVDRSLPLLVIAAVVVFQPELRRGLDRLGRTGVGWGSRPERGEVVDSLARAATRLSADHHGGLIVIERNTGLQDVIDTGVRVDARVSPELLAGIFFPNSPLHDMAVVMRDDRVVAAGCVLPLASELPTNARNLGTRHRAALGITEHTDAVSIVVSEETGDISLALAGRLVRVPDERRLRAMLETVLTQPRLPSRNGGVPV